MNYEELTNIIKLAPEENEQWDFKEKWHESNGELLRDIINFTNTPSHNDAYIIFGISDHCILQVKSAEKCNDFLHSLAAHFLFYLVI